MFHTNITYGSLSLQWQRRTANRHFTPSHHLIVTQRWANDKQWRGGHLGNPYPYVISIAFYILSWAYTSVKFLRTQNNTCFFYLLPNMLLELTVNVGLFLSLDSKRYKLLIFTKCILQGRFWFSLIRLHPNKVMMCIKWDNNRSF